MLSLGRGLMLVGVVLLLIGGVIYLAGRTGLPLGRLPGDIRIQTGSMTCFIPIVTSILLSIVLTVVLNVIIRFFNR